MAYSDFTSLSKVRQTLGLEIQDEAHLFAQAQVIPASQRLTEILAENTDLAAAIATEKAKSELLITPILLEVRRICQNQVGFFSGVEFSVEPSLGLNGACDYLLTASANQSLITAPVLTLVEAKNDLLKNGLGQCAAQMYAAWLFNEREGTPQAIVHGAVSTGTTWKFLTLQNTRLMIDLREYYINQIEHILGILVNSLQSHITAMV